MKTVTYEQIEELATDLAGRPRGKLPTSERTMLRAFFAEELPDIWNREAWPETCDHIEAVTLDANNCFSLREGEDDEMGDILAIVYGGDPRTTNQVTVLDQANWARLDNRVNVLALTTGGGLYVDWQTPPPDLLDDDFIIAAVNDDAATTIALALPLFELPARFKLALAARGAALLIAEENPAQAGVLRGLAEANLTRQASRLKKPWWRG